VPILSDWSEERYPLYAYYASRHLPPAKIRAFLDFVQEIIVEDVPRSGAHGNRSGSRSTATSSK
jgi:DNA-binding transcriptional LysR family regulator